MGNELEGRRDGQEVFASAVYITDTGWKPEGEPLTVHCYASRGVVFNASRGLIESGALNTIRAVTPGEKVHDNEAEAWRGCADHCRRAAAVLLAEADRCDCRASDVAATAGAA